MASVAGWFAQQSFTDSGDALAGGRLYTFAYGTTSLKVAFTDQAGTIPHTYTSDSAGGQYIGLNMRGELPAPLYLASGSYDIALRRADGSTVWTKRADPAASSAQVDNFTSALAGAAGAGSIGYHFGDAYPSGSTGAKLNEWIDPVFDFGAVGDGVADDRAALQAAIDFCLSSGCKELRSRRQFAVAGTLEISNFAVGFRLVLGGLVAHSTFPAPPTTPGGWKSATPLLRMGNVGGSQVGLNVEILNVDGGGKADVIWITNNGCGGSRFHFDRVKNANIIVKLSGNTAPTASNYFTGSYWEASTMGGYVHGDGSVCEGTTFDVGFIAGCKYGGLVFGDRSQYANVRGQLDFNGQWVTEMAVNALQGFTIGDQVNNASGSFGEVLATYTYQGGLYILLIETKSTTGGMTNFAVGNNLTNGYALATIVGIRTSNQNGDNRFFDIVSALTVSQPFWRALILCPYLGGIVGNLIWNATVDFGNSNNSYSTWIAGLEIYNSGSTLSLADKRSSDASFLDVNDTIFAPRRDVFLGGFAIRGPDTLVTIANTGTANFLTLPTPAVGGNGAVWNVVAINPNDAAMRCKGTVFIAAGSAAGVLADVSQSNVALTLVGLTLRIAQGTGADKPMYMTATRVL